MLVPNRHASSNSYRYGFQGQEKDNELKGAGNSYDFGARMLDPRIGRWFAPDRLESKMPSYSTYSFALNNPIGVIDKGGDFPVWIHYMMTYKAMINSGIDKRTAHEIAYYASTYADNPNATFMGINKALAINYFYDPSRLDYDQELGANELPLSQSDELIESVSIHAMMTYWEDIAPAEALKRALYGGTFLDREGNSIKIVGACTVVSSFKGMGFQNLTKNQKKMLGKALHTIQDAMIHKGGRWVDEHKDEAEVIYGHKSDHPDIYEALVTSFYQSSEVTNAIKATVKIITDIRKNESFNKNAKIDIKERNIKVKDKTSTKKPKIANPRYF